MQEEGKRRRRRRGEGEGEEEEEGEKEEEIVEMTCVQYDIVMKCFCLAGCQISPGSCDHAAFLAK